MYLYSRRVIFGTLSNIERFIIQCLYYGESTIGGSTVAIINNHSPIWDQPHSIFLSQNTLFHYVGMHCEYVDRMYMYAYKLNHIIVLGGSTL